MTVNNFAVKQMLHWAPRGR